MPTTTAGPVIGGHVREIIAEWRELSAQSAAICAKPVADWTADDDAALERIARTREMVGASLAGAVGNVIDQYDREHAC